MDRSPFLGKLYYFLYLFYPPLSLSLSLSLFLSSYLRTLANVVFIDDASRSYPLLSIIPSLSPAAIIQQFIPLICFPTYFDSLYQMISEFEKKSKKAGLSTPPVKPKHPDEKVKKVTLHSLASQVDVGEVTGFIADRLLVILPQLDTDGLQLLMLFVFPLFEHQLSCYEAIFNLFDPLCTYLKQCWIQQFMTAPFLSIFDASDEPSHKCYILSRSVADKLITWFGLSFFLNRFLHCIIESLIEPLMGSAAQRQASTQADRLMSSSKTTSSQTRRLSLSRLASTLSPTQTLKPTLSFTWKVEEVCESDNGESDSEADLSFPEASLLVGHTPMVPMFGSLSDVEPPTPIPEAEEPPMEPDTAAPERKEGTALQEQSSIEDRETPKNEIVSSSPAQSNIDYMGCHGEPSPISTEVAFNVPPEDELKNEDLVLTEPPCCAPPMESSHLDEGEEEGDAPFTEGIEVSNDPLTIGMRTRISEVASDCLVWLMWRLGPILATKHIAHPLLDNIHRLVWSQDQQDWFPY